MHFVSNTTSIINTTPIINTNYNCYTKSVNLFNQSYGVHIMPLVLLYSGFL